MRSGIYKSQRANVIDVTDTKVYVQLEAKVNKVACLRGLEFDTQSGTFLSVYSSRRTKCVSSLRSLQRRVQGGMEEEREVSMHLHLE